MLVRQVAPIVSNLLFSKAKSCVVIRLIPSGSITVARDKANPFGQPNQDPVHLTQQDAR
ncbi:MAG: hypothetical protein IJS00_06740 [Paludibacteraceae bacterium]|nr:hypothetical protein [Paludibacteraceae bacterium]